MGLYLTPLGHANFTQMVRCGYSRVSRFFQNFKKSFDWVSFNWQFMGSASSHHIAVDLCFVFRTGRKVRLQKFVFKYGHGKHVMTIFREDTSAKDIFDIYRTGLQLKFVCRDVRQFTGLSHCKARNIETMSFAFKVSLPSVNVAQGYAYKERYNHSVCATKNQRCHVGVI